MIGVPTESVTVRVVTLRSAVPVLCNVTLTLIGVLAGALKGRVT